MTTAGSGIASIAVDSIVECQVMAERIRFCVGNREDHIQAYHAQGRFYEEAQLAALARIHPADRVFLDIGANIGNHTLYMARIAKARRVVPFEVNPQAIALLRINLALNDCQNVDDSYLGIGLASRQQRMSRAESFADNLGGTRFDVGDSGEFLCLPGDALVAQLPVGTIKIDVEGMEMDVLAGLATTIARWRPALFIELEHRFNADFEAWMRELRYDVTARFAPYYGKTELLLMPG